MAKPSKTFDVFISYAASEAHLAKDVAKACRANGLEPFAVIELKSCEDIGDALWDALAECRALLAILSPTGPTPSMAIEIGAAQAWNKPIFAVVTDPPHTRLPRALSSIRLYPLGRIDDAIEAIKRSDQHLSGNDLSLLAELYSNLGVSVDQLALDAKHLGSLVKRFNARSGKTTSGELLLSELLRLRKQGKLTKSRTLRHSTPPAKISAK